MSRPDAKQDRSRRGRPVAGAAAQATLTPAEDATRIGFAARGSRNGGTEMPVENKHPDLVITRVVDAPVGQVWQAWTDPELVRRWWGPTGFTCPLARIDLREGGTSLVAMRSPAGQDLYNTWTYRSVVPLQRLEFIQNFADEEGNTITPASIGLPPELPQDVRNLVTFNALGEHRTELTVTEYGYVSDQILELSKAGLEQVLDKLATSLQQPRDA
jgi:uncharacterized protein YndB with AHSA1/START domain